MPKRGRFRSAQTSEISYVSTDLMAETNSISSFTQAQTGILPVEKQKSTVTFERVIIVVLLLIMCCMLYLIVKNQIHIQTMSEELIALRVLVQQHQKMTEQQN